MRKERKYIGGVEVEMMEREDAFRRNFFGAKERAIEKKGKVAEIERRIKDFLGIQRMDELNGIEMDMEVRPGLRKKMRIIKYHPAPYYSFELEYADRGNPSRLKYSITAIGDDILAALKTAFLELK